MSMMKYGIDGSGKAVIVLIIEGDKVRLLSENAKFSNLNGKPMSLRVSDNVGSITVEEKRLVKPGEPGYHDAVIDTLEGMQIDVVG
jgi:hypothetical protein